MSQSIAQMIDHTLLKPEATSADIRKLCDEAIEHGFFSVCVNSSMVPLAAERLKGSSVAVCAVVGFPLGACLTSVKRYETVEALRAGATEIDMVLAVGALKEERFETVQNDIHAVVEAAGPRVVKVILETHLLSDSQKRKACELALAAGAAFVKTSTGFTGGGATLEDVTLMKSMVGTKAKVKASGGIRDLEKAQALIAAGAERLGTSSGVAIVKGLVATGAY
jgi:deoxyribose-phosphate aldolase